MENLFETPKSKVYSFDFETEFRNMILRADGNDCPLKAMMKLKEIENSVKTAKAQIMPFALNEISYYEKDKTEIDGIKISTTQSGKYDYSEIQEIKDLQDKIKDLQDKAKNAYKAGLNSNTIIDKVTGEIIQPAIYKSNNKSIKIGQYGIGRKR